MGVTDSRYISLKELTPINKSRATPQNPTEHPRSATVYLQQHKSDVEIFCVLNTLFLITTEM